MLRISGPPYKQAKEDLGTGEYSVTVVTLQRYRQPALGIGLTPDHRGQLLWDSTGAEAELSSLLPTIAPAGFHAAGPQTRTSTHELIATLASALPPRPFIGRVYCWWVYAFEHSSHAIYFSGANGAFIFTHPAPPPGTARCAPGTWNPCRRFGR